jgi:hypothetical protein
VLSPPGTRGVRAKAAQGDGGGLRAARSRVVDDPHARCARCPQRGSSPPLGRPAGG